MRAAGAMLLTGGRGLLAGEDDLGSTIEELGSADSVVRENAVQNLADQGATGLDALLDALADDHTPLQVAGVAEAVRRIGIGASDVEDVATLLTEASPPTRHAAITILAQQAAAARDDLAALATNETELPPLRASAALALSGAGAQARSTLRRLSFDPQGPEVVRKASLRALAQVSTDGAGDVGSLAADGEQPWALRRAAILALGDPNAPGDSALATLLGSRDARVRVSAVEALVSRGATANVAQVAGRLTDSSAEVRYAALRGLTLLGAAAASRTAVIGRMLDADPRIQALAAEVVGQTCTDIKTTVRPALVSLLASTNFNVRHKAALALFAHGSTTGAPTMLADSKSTNPSVARQALQAYNQIMGR